MSATDEPVGAIPAARSAFAERIRAIEQIVDKWADYSIITVVCQVDEDRPEGYLLVELLDTRGDARHASVWLHLGRIRYLQADDVQGRDRRTMEHGRDRADHRCLRHAVGARRFGAGQVRGRNLENLHADHESGGSTRRTAVIGIMFHLPYWIRWPVVGAWMTRPLPTYIATCSPLR